jgi:alpha-beta hydrolase superfamily lysophospholipase
VTKLLLHDELLDAQLLRTVGAASCGGADIGECLTTAARVDEASLSSWYEEWLATAERVLALAADEEARGNTVSARDAYFRAANYLRNAGVMLMGTPIDERLRSSNARQTEAFRRGAALLALPPELLAIPFEDTTLPGYFFRAGADGPPRPTVIALGGYDSTAEELYFANGRAALERGYHVLAFDGPGQGSALLQQGLTLRPDFEHVVGAVLDHLAGRAEVDMARVALIGLSLGAHLGPRAASGEHRLAACIADCGSYDLYAGALERFPDNLAAGLGDDPVARAALEDLLGSLEAQPTAGWALRRGQLVHGVDSPTDYLRSMQDYSLVGRAEDIRCPTFVCNAEGDRISESAPQLVAALTCEHEFVQFRTEEGAGDHCESGARSLYHARSFGWLDRVLGNTPAG